MKINYQFHSLEQTHICPFSTLFYIVLISYLAIALRTIIIPNYLCAGYKQFDVYLHVHTNATTTVAIANRTLYSPLQLVDYIIQYYFA